MRGQTCTHTSCDRSVRMTLPDARAHNQGVKGPNEYYCRLFNARKAVLLVCVIWRQLQACHSPTVFSVDTATCVWSAVSEICAGPTSSSVIPSTVWPRMLKYPLSSTTIVIS